MVAKYYSKGKFFLLVVLGIFASGENILGAYIVESLTNMATAGKMNELPRFLLTALVMAVFFLAAMVGYDYFYNDAIRSTNNYLRREIFAGMLEDTSEENASALGFLTGDFKLLETNRFGAELNMIYYCSMLVISLGYALYINWLLTLIFFLGSGFSMLVSSFFQKSLQKASDKWTAANKHYVSQTKNFLAGTDSLRLYRRQSSAVNKNQTWIGRLEQALFRMNFLNMTTQSVLSIIAGAGSFLLPFILGVYLIVKGQTTIGALMAVIQLSNTFFSPIMGMLDERNHLSTTKNIVVKVNKYLAKANEKQPAAITAFRQELAFAGIELERGKQTLAQGINLQIKPGQKIAVIGASGSGKSTLLRFMMTGKFGRAEKITVDGKAYQAGQLTDLFAYASQAPVIFADDLWFNLTLGANLPKVKVTEICAELQLGDVVKDKGFAYQLGDNADQLSGGQLARIELARALLSGRPVLLLDEFNASLDKSTSAAIHKYLLASDLTFVEVIHHYEPGELANYDQVLDFTNYR
ncbi:ABC transporter ATP-binding protein [Lactobacillus sp. ESL0791]|uniref:ATP-binding cassette domain-containing protein n=1 Tax=Lactobacillus sp. ESL0791 TaxID=2983234 RepID=UPI0023F8B1D1|nr:ABC transporter ATP-binding protein [Lactobacillus sp. ESL0791]MDF7639636.1 ABC transporter ATP-binding protein [Lactobacillus sp. ESL0791]